MFLKFYAIQKEENWTTIIYRFPEKNKQKPTFLSEIFCTLLYNEIKKREYKQQIVITNK